MPQTSISALISASLPLFFSASLTWPFMACASKKDHRGESAPVKVSSGQAADKKSAKQSEKKESDPELAMIEKKYASAKSVQMDVKKSLALALLDRMDTYNGRLFLSGKEKLRLEFDEPVKSIAVLNGKDFWVIEYPPEGTDEKVRVLRSTLGEKSQSQVLMTALLGRGRILDHFKIDSKKAKGSVVSYKLSPSNSLGEVKKLEILIDKEKGLIKELSYEDELENKTKFEFSSVSFDADVSDKIFVYAPPKGAEVSQL